MFVGLLQVVTFLGSEFFMQSCIRSRAFTSINEFSVAGCSAVHSAAAFSQSTDLKITKIQKVYQNLDLGILQRRRLGSCALGGTCVMT